tara:strand:- start:131 stop:991 length:861 start_codon:yes stop_codon:yes gene_type:complete
LPELPEVETVRRGLEKKLKNFIISDIEVIRPSTIAYPTKNDEFIEGLNNSLIDKWSRRGKYLIANLINIKDSSNSIKNGNLIIHLRMTGHFNWLKRTNSACKHTRVRFFDDQKNELRFIDVRSFGQIWWIREGLDPTKIIKGLGSLGPEPFSKEFNVDYLKKEFSKRSKSVKAVLLDQKIIAGIGNIYADESLFEAGISPFRKARTIKNRELVKLRVAIIEVLEKSIGSGGTTFSDFRNIEGLNGNYSMQANVYKRNGKECKKCTNFIQKDKITGRSTHWCSRCQK